MFLKDWGPAKAHYTHAPFVVCTRTRARLHDFDYIIDDALSKMACTFNHRKVTQIMSKWYYYHIGIFENMVFRLSQC